MIGFFFDDSQAVSDNIFFPSGVFATQGTDVAFNEGDRCFKFMTDNRDEGIFYFFRITKFSYVAHGSDDISKCAIGSQEWGIGDSNRQIGRFKALQIAFDV